jgi:hypothetical protein
MKSRILSATALILLTPLVVLAFQAQADQVHKNELKNKPFIRGPLKITLIQIIYGGNGIKVEVENTSDDSTTFAPRRLSFIDKDDNQVDILGQLSAMISGMVTAEDKRIAPKARIKHLYTLTDKLQLPARLYYEDKLLATIVE